MQKKTYTAALIIIGNEILSGRTKDANTSWIAEKLVNRGITLREVRTIPDEKQVIADTVNELRGREDYVFTTGGIGPTHDDITAESIAHAFGVELELNDEAYAELLAHYKDESEITPARKKMAMIPEGATLINNPVSGAAGIVMENVYVMAGVPRIMQAMFDSIVDTLAEGLPIISQTITCELPESAIADGLTAIQGRHPETDIGSYPNYRMGVFGVSLVIRSTDKEAVRAAGLEVIALVQSLGVEPSAVTVLE
jgi:molybdenum cofactor synthesis domain-containing protein